jgi:Zn-dependent peptidase ImmA (M78 family)
MDRLAKRKLVERGLLKALQVRKSLGIELTESVCPFQSAFQMGIDVRFDNFPSLDGMYLKIGGKDLIVVSCHRPAGRRAFSCAHELGHCLLSHQTSLDEYLADEASEQRNKNDPNEIAADAFASYFLRNN